MKENNDGNDTNVGSMENSIKEDKYAKELIKKVKEIEIGLNYYIERSQQLENELKQYESMYKNRVEEYLRLKQQTKELQKENEELKDFKKQVTNIENTNFIKYKNCIPIQTIEDKIEDLKMSGGSDGKDNTENTARELVIEVLQDILDESKEK